MAWQQEHHAQTLVARPPGKKVRHDIQIRGWQCLWGEHLNREAANRPWCEALYEERAPGLILYGRALGLDHGEAEDVVHEVFAVLLGLPEPPTRPDRYLVRAFRNRALNHRRSLWRRVAREFESRRWFEPMPDETARERDAMRCLAELPPEQREVIVLKVWHRHTFDEIGELLGLSPNTAAGRYRYGLQKLRACLRDTTDEDSHEPQRPLGRTALFLDAAPPIARA
jgi:RNA polymerase sigma-70 factor (ECF subfamily)